MISARALLASAIGLGLSTGGAVAFECPQHIQAAEQQITKVEDDMKGMEAMMSQEDMMLVHTLLDDAKMLLESARHNHEKPQGAYDHARAIAKADAAKGFAAAADILHFKQMQQTQTKEKGGGMGSMQPDGDMQHQHGVGQMPKQ